ncbi:MAG: T9SS C-terminal target domain-containing protein [Flavobacteriales bacterium]|nr:T9SS C-terminal target domain-containing protein [Crocinitomicaceae bacterium]NBX80053.1 T9SS C-terminal target domain-containing protein [Flavobacteriales bacterium]NCA20368.1 T9SS C-terminal target domain-containing protein [Crocinitomicaceae bacterium]
MKLFKLFILTFFVSANVAFGQVNSTNRQIVLQGFWWNYYNSNYTDGWANYLTELAPRLKSLGIDAVWIPPTIKNTGTNSVGYAPFDHYDLGDKWQKNSTKTRLGDKDEVLRMVAVMKANGIDVIQDIVLNHVTGAGGATSAGGQDPAAMEDGTSNDYKNFRYACYETPAQNETALNYLARKGRFPKNWQNFYPNPSNVCCTNPINSPYWGPDISYESSGFGQSSNATFNPTQTSDYMRTNMRNWLIWYKKQVGWDGVRIDAVKHFPTNAMEDFLWNLQNNAVWASGTDNMFAVGEWVGGTSELDNWVNAVQNRAGTFDFAIRGAIQNMVNGNGAYDLSNIPGSQQSNRGRTVPFVNNHDTFRPILSTDGNYTGWNSGSQLGTQIEPNDGRNSAAHAIALSLDGAPQVFFEDVFNIGYLGNRYDHSPTVDSTLPVRSDIQNLIWCHQNLHFKDGAYLVRWQAADALVIERSAKALIGVTDSWTNWQNLDGVQTSWSDGTVLVDYSGANGTATRTVYGGGKVNISIPPCDGTASQGRRGYCVWAPQGITENYVRPAKAITQEWEMADDLGDRHINSLQQGGKLPTNSLDCRTVGRIFAKSGSTIKLELYPEIATNSVCLVLLNKDCNPVDSLVGVGNLVFNKLATYDGWYTIRIRNATATQAGQKCWVKATYNAPEVVQTNVTKNKCSCSITPANVGIEEINEQVTVYPNPSNDKIYIESAKVIGDWSIYDLNGKVVETGNASNSSFNIDISSLKEGSYIFVSEMEGYVARKKIVKITN